MVERKLAETMRIDLIPGVSGAPGKKKASIGTAGSRFRNRRSPDSEGDVQADAYTELLQSVYDGVVITDLSGLIHDVNHRAAELLGYDSEELCGQSILGVVNGADEGLLQTLQQELEHHRYSLIQAYCLRKDGSFFPSEIAVNLLRLNETRLCFCLRDTTVRRQAEERLRTEHAAIQNSGSGIAVADASGVIQYANPAMGSLWRVEDQAAFLHVDVCSLFRDGDRVAAILESVMNDRQAWMGVLEAVRADQEPLEVQVSAACNRDAEGDVVGIVLSFVDVSDRKRAEQASREAERHRVMLESLGSVSHLMGQPATALLGNLKMLSDRAGDADDETRRLIQMCSECADQVAEILHRLHRVDQYRTKPYLSAIEDGTPELGAGNRILDI